METPEQVPPRRTRQRLVWFFVCLLLLSLAVFGIIGALALLVPPNDPPALSPEQGRAPEVRLLDRESLQQNQQP